MVLYFNENSGYLEAIVRGYKEGLLKISQYSDMTQCQTMEDLRLQLSATDYGQYLQNEPSPLATSTLAARCSESLVQQFTYLRANSSEPLSNPTYFYGGHGIMARYGYMIDNVILLITGTLHSRDTRELLERCHPLGIFDTMAALCVATSISELFNLVLIETPLAPYFKSCLSVHDLDEMNIEIIRNLLYKAYIEDFHQFCVGLGGATAVIMDEILQFEADRRVISITVNSLNTELGKDERKKLYPLIGKLNPDGIAKLSRVDEYDQVKTIIDAYIEYRPLFDTFMSSSGSERTMEDKFFEMEVKLNKGVFLQQFHYAIFFSFVRLKEQEIRNIVWIAECISQQQREKINNFINIF